MGAFGRPARRLKAGLAALFLITLAAALAPQVAQAQVTVTLTATPGPGQVTLTWTTSSPTPAGFLVTRLSHRPAGGSYQSKTLTSANSGSYTLTGLTPGTSYDFFLSNNWSGHGQVDSNTVSATPTAVTTLAAPTSLTATPGGPAQVLLTWTKPTGTITGYKLRYAKTPSKASATWGTMTGSGANTVRHMVTGLDNGSEYSFMIRAVNASGDGAATDWVTATPANSCPGVGAPTNLSLAPRSDGFAVTWTAPTDVLRNGWELSYKKTGGSSTSVTISNAAATSHTLTGLEAGTEYEIALQATHPFNPDPTASCPPGSRAKATGTTTAAATAGVTISPTSLTVEEGSSETYTVKLDKAPSANVTITVGGASGEVTVAGSPLTFTPSNFSTAQTITVRAAADDDTLDDTATLTHAASSTDTDYGASLDIDDVDVTVTDTTPILQLLTDPAAVTEGTAISLTVTSDKAQTGDLTVSMVLSDRGSSGFDADDITGTLGPRAFIVAFGNTASTTGTVTIPTSTDSTVEGAETYRITLEGGAGTYKVGTDATADGTLNDGTTASVPAAPAGLSAEAGNAQVKLTWTDPDDDSITRYRVQQRKGTAAWGSWTAIPGSDADTVSYTVTGLTNDSEYRFRIRARNSGGNGAASAVVEATPSASAAVPKPVLSAEAGYARVTLSWSALSGVTVASWGYQYKPAGGSWIRTRTVTGGSTTSTTVTGLTIGTEYTFRLFAAVSPGVQSVWSDQVKATPTNTVPKPVLTAAGGDASVTLSWSALTGIPITSWGYQYKSTGGWSTTTTLTGASRTSVRVTGLTKGTDYTFRLFAAVRPGEQSVWSDQVTAKTDPAAPVLTAATSTTNGQIDLTWTHAGGSNELSDADDYVKDAAKFHWWRAQTRLKGASTWTDHSLNQASARQNPGSRNNRLLLNYPDGASVEVRVRATGYRMAGVAGGTGNLQGPWSNIRTVTFKDDTTAALTLTGTPVTVAPGSTATYTVALTKAYAGTLRVTSDDTAAARVSPASLTFTTSNYSTARTVTVTGVANGTAVINHAFRLTGASADAIPDAGTVDVTVADTPGVTVSTAALTVAEGGSRTYTMRLNTPPTSDVTITVAGASGDVTVTGASLTFTRANWNQPQTVTVNAGTDTDTTTDAAVTLTHSASGGGYASVTIASVVVSVAEKDVAPGKPAGLAGAAGNASVTLSWTDPDNPTITKWQVRRKAGSDDWGAWEDIPGSAAGTTSYEVSGLTNGTAYQFEVRAVNGAGNGAGPDAPVTATPAAPVAPGGGGGGGGGGGTTPTADASVTVTPTALTVAEGSSAAYTVVLDTEPSGEVTVTVGGASGEVTVEPASLTFTTANWDTAQRVTVRAARDEDTTDDTATLTHGASGGGYASVTIDSVAVTVTDTTLLPVLTLAQDPAAVTEGEAIRLVVSADRALTGSLRVSLTLASRDGGGFDAGDVPGGLGPRSFDAVFGAAGRRTGVVTIPTAADADAEGAEAYRITLNDAADYVVGNDATALGVLRDRAAGSMARSNRVNAAVLPHVAAAAMSQTLGAVTGRIEAVASGEGGGTVQFGALPSPVEDAWASPHPEEPGPSMAEVLDGASFTLAAGAEGEASAPPLAVWGRGAWLSLSGSQGGVSWDGGLWSAQLGADVRLRPDLLAGAALSHVRGELDTQTDQVKGVHETTITSVHPYAAWLLADGSTLWASLGYGTGEVRIAEEGAPVRSTDLAQWSAAAGARSVLIEHADLIEGGMTRLAVKGEGALARLRTGSDDGLAGLTARTTRLRLLLEGSHEHALASGATLTPALEAGVRHDAGDAAEGAGIEAGASVTWRDPAEGLTAELRTRLLAAHEADRDEWGVSALVRLDPGADGLGTFLAFGPAHGRTESDLGELFDHGLPAAVSDTTSAEGRLEAEAGHGFGLAGPGPLVVLTPWAGLSLAETGGRTLRLGARYRMGAGLSLGLEGAHRPGPVSEDSLMLRGALNW